MQNEKKLMKACKSKINDNILKIVLGLKQPNIEQTISQEVHETKRERGKTLTFEINLFVNHSSKQYFF